MDISKMSIVELKALAFDELVKIEMANKNLQTLNQTIAQKQKEPPVELPREEENVNKG